MHFEIDNKKVDVYYNELSKLNKVPMIIINTFDEDGSEIWNNSKMEITQEYILVCISNIDWNKDMTPWFASKIFKGEDDYQGKADDYIRVLTENIIPKLKSNFNNIGDIIIAGYSLAGLFAIYSLYKTDVFSSAISCSGSLWYPNFIEYVKNNSFLNTPNKIYFSLGNKEAKSRNELMSKVEINTKFIESYYKEKGVETIYEENKGNHFQDVISRITKGIKWILE